MNNADKTITGTKTTVGEVKDNAQVVDDQTSVDLRAGLIKDEGTNANVDLELEEPLL